MTTSYFCAKPNAMPSSLGHLTIRLGSEAISRLPCKKLLWICPTISSQILCDSQLTSSLKINISFLLGGAIWVSPAASKFSLHFDCFYFTWKIMQSFKRESESILYVFCAPLVFNLYQETASLTSVLGSIVREVIVSCCFSSFLFILLIVGGQPVRWIVYNEDECQGKMMEWGLLVGTTISILCIPVVNLL